VHGISISILFKTITLSFRSSLSVFSFCEDVLFLNFFYFLVGLEQTASAAAAVPAAGGLRQPYHSSSSRHKNNDPYNQQQQRMKEKKQTATSALVRPPHQGKTTENK